MQKINKRYLCNRIMSKYSLLSQGSTAVIHKAGFILRAMTWARATHGIKGALDVSVTSYTSCVFLNSATTLGTIALAVVLVFLHLPTSCPEAVIQ